MKQLTNFLLNPPCYFVFTPDLASVLINAAHKFLQTYKFIGESLAEIFLVNLVLITKT